MSESKTKTKKPEPNYDYVAQRVLRPNDGRLSEDLYEVIQIPPEAHPFKYENIWETELCDFFEDCDEFCYAHWCYAFYICRLYSEMDEFCPINYILLPNHLLTLRTKMRAVFRIKGGMCSDSCAAFCCAACTAFQMRQELKYKGIIPDN